MRLLCESKVNTTHGSNASRASAIKYKGMANYKVWDVEVVVNAIEKIHE